MTFGEAMEAAAAGRAIKRAGWNTPIFTLQREIVPLFMMQTNGQPAPQQGYKFLVNEINAPVGFGLEDMAATDWEAFP